MPETDGARLTLDVAYEPPGEARDLFALDEEALHRVAALALARVGVTRPVEISVLVGDDEGIRVLNRDYRGHDEATDVLSFPLLDAPLVSAPEDQLWQPSEEDLGRVASSFDPPLAPPDDSPDLPETPEDGAGLEEEDGLPAELPLHLGDIAISRQAVVRQAAQAEHSVAWEMAYLLAHGVLHLVGFDDHTDAGYDAMVAHQEAILAAASIAR
jgi:probable rRNA maturation factor